VGTWDYEVTVQGTAQSGSITLSGTNESLSGTISSDADTTPLQDVALDGATLTATFAFQGQSVRLTLTLTGDTFAGTADVGPLSLPISGTRRPN